MLSEFNENPFTIIFVCDAITETSLGMGVGEEIFLSACVMDFLEQRCRFSSLLPSSYR